MDRRTQTDPRTAKPTSTGLTSVTARQPIIRRHLQLLRLDLAEGLLGAMPALRAMIGPTLGSKTRHAVNRGRTLPEGELAPSEVGPPQGPERGPRKKTRPGKGEQAPCEDGNKPLLSRSHGYQYTRDGPDAGRAATDAGDVATEAGGVATLAGGVATEAGRVATLAGGVATEAGRFAMDAGIVATEAGGIATLAGGVATDAERVATLAGDVATEVGRVATLAGGVATLAGGVATEAGCVATLAGDVATEAGRFAMESWHPARSGHPKARNVVPAERRARERVSRHPARTETSHCCLAPMGDGPDAGRAATDAGDVATDAGDVATEAGGVATLAAGVATEVGRVATDAGVVATDAARVATLAGGVAADAGDVATEAGRVATLAGGVATLAGGVATEGGCVATVAGDVATEAGRIATDAGDVATKAGRIATLAGGIATDAGGVATDAGRVATEAGRVATLAGGSATDAGGGATLAGHVATEAGRVATLAGSVATEAGRVATLAGGVATDAGRVATDAGGGATLAGRVAMEAGCVAMLAGRVATEAGRVATDAGLGASLAGFVATEAPAVATMARSDVYPWHFGNGSAAYYRGEGCRASETRVAQRLAGGNASKMHVALPSPRHTSKHVVVVVCRRGPPPRVQGRARASGCGEPRSPKDQQEGKHGDHPKFEHDVGTAGGLCAPARGNAACAAQRLARPSVAHDADDGYACGSGCRGQGATRRARPSTLRGHVAEDGYLFVSTPEGQRVVLTLRLGSTYDGARCGVGWACCLRRCGCSAIARSTSRIWLSLECSSSLPPNPAQRR
ncbi:hypothetical protein Ahy_B01g054348 [Arachis hypogaea]|uniref:Uncharacterized protein n=1 Tax=Arachis hypogaea TaxID=3818 RepID=A0A445ATQ8_ARAHY|nr:hypothetical protein Ahy_B01g054348 [Arachis hypogaea]